MSTTSPVAPDEEAARAELYGLLAQLYYAAPDADTLFALRRAPIHAPEAEGSLYQPWQQLLDAARSLDGAEIAQEFDRLFGGLGRPEVDPYASQYLSGFLNEKPLARLRADLDRFALTRSESMPETEDHIACLCEVMRYLIAGDDPACCHLAAQRDFFARHVQPWVLLLCENLAAHPQARFYAAVARLTSAFVAVESQGFELFDAA